MIVMWLQIANVSLRVKTNPSIRDNISNVGKSPRVIFFFIEEATVHFCVCLLIQDKLLIPDSKLLGIMSLVVF